MTVSVVVCNFKSPIPLYAACLEETVSYLPGLEILCSILKAKFYLRLTEPFSGLCIEPPQSIPHFHTVLDPPNLEESLKKITQVQSTSVPLMT